ncbi:MAG: TldD/PmbA family protein [Thermaurantiacus sp.]
MISPNTALDRLEHAITLALRLGATAADAVLVAESATGIGVRLGKLEDIGRSETEEMGLRLFRGARSAQVSISDLSDTSIRTAVERALAMAETAPEDRFAGLAPVEMLAHGPFPDFESHDPAAGALPAERLKEMALEAEDAARAVPGISNSEGGSASGGESLTALMTSHGFAAARHGSHVSVSAVAIAGDGERRQRDYDWSQARHLEDLEPPARIGRTAGERAVARLDPVRPGTGSMPVIFDPRVSASLLSHLVAAISGPAIARKTSFLLGREEEALFDPAIRIVDDPHRRRGLRSRAFDGEGLPTTGRDLVSDGRIAGWLMESASARQLGLAPTGHASRGITGPPGVAVSNLHMEPGSVSPDELMADVARGLYVTELIGMGVNLITGDYSRGAGGFLIRDGRIAEPVSEVTIAGSLPAMFRALRPANDLHFRQAMNAPTLRIDDMTVAGG